MDNRDARVVAADGGAIKSDVAPLASTALDRWALARIQRMVKSAAIRFVLWDGFELSPARPPVATILLKNRSALFGWVWDSELNFGEAYMSGAVEIRGDLLLLARAVPPGVSRALALRLLGTPWFVRQVVLNRWFLGREGSRPGLAT